MSIGPDLIDACARAIHGRIEPAGRPWTRLDEDERADNRAAAAHALALIGANRSDAAAGDRSFIEKAAGAVHEDWLARHPDAAPALALPYAALAGCEREKDRQVVRAALGCLGL